MCKLVYSFDRFMPKKQLYLSVLYHITKQRRVETLSATIHLFQLHLQISTLRQKGV